MRGLIRSDQEIQFFSCDSYNGPAGSALISAVKKRGSWRWEQLSLDVWTQKQTNRGLTQSQTVRQMKCISATHSLPSSKPIPATRGLCATL